MYCAQKCTPYALCTGVHSLCTVHRSALHMHCIQECTPYAQCTRECTQFGLQMGVHSVQKRVHSICTVCTRECTPYPLCNRECTVYRSALHMHCVQECTPYALCTGVHSICTVHRSALHMHCAQKCTPYALCPLVDNTHHRYAVGIGVKITPKSHSYACGLKCDMSS